jgi:predicted transcriptional regulator
MSTTLVAKTLKNLQESTGISCKELADSVGVSPSAISRYGSGSRNIPEDIISNLARQQGMEELKLVYLSEKKLDIINAPIMNGIDDNVQTMIFKFIYEEIPEAVEALHNISKLTMNKKSIEDKSQREQLYREIEQVIDLIPGFKTFLIRLKQTYNVSLERLDIAECKKLKQRGYVVDVG